MAGASEKEKEGERENVSSSRQLHNFTLPSRLKWGNQKHLRCMKVPHPHRMPTSSNFALNPTFPSVDHPQERSNLPVSIPRGSPVATPPTPHKNVTAKSPIHTATWSTSVASVPAADTTGIEAVREKLLNDLKLAADQLKLPTLEDKERDSSNNEKKPSEEELPWNLRTRRPAAKASNDGGNVGSSPFQDKGEGSGSGDHQRPRFSRTLTKEEIEADFLLMTGAKPPRRPKKRSKALQKQIDALSPGSWLTEVTPENYTVPDASEAKGEK